MLHKITKRRAPRAFLATSVATWGVVLWHAIHAHEFHGPGLVALGFWAGLAYGLLNFWPRRKGERPGHVDSVVHALGQVVELEERRPAKYRGGDGPKRGLDHR